MGIDVQDVMETDITREFFRWLVCFHIVGSDLLSLLFDAGLFLDWILWRRHWLSYGELEFQYPIDDAQQPLCLCEANAVFLADYPFTKW